MKGETYLLAIDIGGTTIKLGLYSNEPNPTLLHKKVIPTRTDHDGANILPDTAKAARALADAYGADDSQIFGVGIGVPGPVLTSAEGTQTVNQCVNLGWKERIQIGAQWQELSGIERVHVLNDANAAALGELHAYHTSGTAPASAPDTRRQSAVMITLGTGVGGGVIEAGRIITGTFGSAGEVGHMPVTPSHPLLNRLIQAGSEIRPSADAEYYTAASGIARIAKEVLTCFEEDTVLRQKAPAPSAKDVFDAAKASDSLATEICAFFFDTLGSVMACIASVTDPDLFIIGGGVSHAGDYLLHGLQEAYRRQVFHASRDTEIRLAQLGNDAGLLGAIVPLIPTCG